MIKLKNILTNLIVEQQANKKIRVLFVGDSQTAAPWSYARLLLQKKEIDGDIVAKNGASTAAVLKMLRDNISEKYDVVSIMAGGNDGAAAKPFGAIENFTAMFSLVRKYNAKLVVITNPTKKFVRKGDTYYKENGYPSNDKISDWLQTQTTSDVVIDTGDFDELDFTKDRVHLDRDAHERIASQWIRKVSDIVKISTDTNIKSDDSILLQYGDRGNDVIQMQDALVKLGYSVGKEGIDGIFGPRTRAGLTKFQQDNNQDPTGKLNTQTKQVLVKAAGLSSSSSINNIGTDTSLSSIISGPVIDGANYNDPTIKQAAALLANFEGFVSEPMWDVNNWRIGFGSSTITEPDGSIERLPSDRSDKPDLTITKKDAVRDLTRRLSSEFIPQVMQHADGLNAGTIAALASVAYNYGSLPNNVKSAMKTNNIKDIARAVLELSSHNSGINKRRRRLEAAYILNSK
jgi:lysophospholipase L1-like esterase/GH24 family phage-related lysozyme (muramidase)